MTSSSHMWVSGIQLLGGILNTTAGGLCPTAYASTAYIPASWYRMDAAGAALYTGYWRCCLASAAGTYSSSWKLTDNTELATSGNYTSLGCTIDGASHNQLLTSTQSTNIVEFYSNQSDSSPKWTSLTETTAAYAPLIASTGTAASSPVLCLFDLSGAGTAYQCTSGTFTITFGTDNTQAGAVFKVTVS